MKRIAALHSLSHDHHQALVVAQKLRRATPETLEATHGAWTAFWAAGQVHFRAEEEILLPAYAGHVAVDDDPAVAQVLLEHVGIRHYAAELERNPDQREAMVALGRLLAEHVRLEERTLFPRIEAALPVNALLHLAKALNLHAHRLATGVNQRDFPALSE